MKQFEHINTIFEWFEDELFDEAQLARVFQTYEEVHFLYALNQEDYETIQSDTNLQD